MTAVPFGREPTALCCVEAPLRTLTFWLDLITAGVSPIAVGTVSAGLPEDEESEDAGVVSLTLILSLVSTKSLLI